MDPKQLQSTLDKFLETIREENQKHEDKSREDITQLLNTKFAESESNIANKFSQISGQISDLQKKQEEETDARRQIEAKMEGLQQQIDSLKDKVEGSQMSAVDTDKLVDSIMPLVTEELSERINDNTAEVKAYNAQAKATYF